MRVYAVIHSVESLDQGYSETSVKFFDYQFGATEEIERIRQSLEPWDDQCGESFDSGPVVPPSRLEWGETKRFIYDDDDSPNQVVTLFSFWTPLVGDYTLVYNQVDNRASVVKTLDAVRSMVEFSHELTWFSELREKIGELCDEGHTMWDADEVCLHYFVVTNVEPDPTLPF